MSMPSNGEKSTAAFSDDVFILDIDNFDHDRLNRYIAGIGCSDDTDMPIEFPDLPVKENEFSASCRVVGGLVGDLFLKNDWLLDQFTLNTSNPKFPENVRLLREVRKNILAIKKELSKVNEPVELKRFRLIAEMDEELAVRVLNVDPEESVITSQEAETRKEIEEYLLGPEDCP